MEIEYGAEVRDKNGKVLGKINRVISDMWTGEPSKFNVSTEFADADLFYSVKDVEESKGEVVKLKIAYGEANTLGIQYGATVIDKNGKTIGKVNYTVSDVLTGEIRKFKVGTDIADGDIIFSTEDVLEATPTEIRLKVSVDEHR